MTLSKIIEQLKAADQNKTGMFELGEDVMCALVDLLERRERDKQEPVLKCSTRSCAAPPAPVVPAAYEIIAEAWRLMDGQNPETSEWHTEASRYLNAYRTARETISNSGDFAIDEAEPVSQPYKLVGEVVAWDHPTKERSVDFRWLNYDVAPGTKLYAMDKE